MYVTELHIYLKKNHIHFCGQILRQAKHYSASLLKSCTFQSPAIPAICPVPKANTLFAPFFCLLMLRLINIANAKRSSSSLKSYGVYSSDTLFRKQ